MLDGDEWLLLPARRAINIEVQQEDVHNDTNEEHSSLVPLDGC